VSIEQGNELLHKANMELQTIWLDQIFLTWRWWVAVSLCVLPWLFWIFWRDKKNTAALLYAGFTVMIIVCYLDSLGMALGFWSYSTKLVPLIPSFPEFDLCAIPVGNMVTLQIFPNIRPILKSLMLAIPAALVFQPFAVVVGLYNPKYWHHYYSIPFVIVIYLIANFMYKKMKIEEGDSVITHDIP